MESQSLQCPEVLFIGSPTNDELIHNERTHQAVGGAAFISALAARWAGASVGIVARVPPAIPHEVASVFGLGGIHRRGLRISEGTLPGFRISYDERERATYDQMQPGLEAQLCAADIPPMWLTPTCKWIHIAGIGASTTQQLEMVQGIHEKAPTWNGVLSAGTCRAMIEAEPTRTMSLLLQCDVFFLNREEFDLLCPEGLPQAYRGTVLITDGANGVHVTSGPHQGTYSTTPVIPTDPTGAGDSFCGGFIGTMVSEGNKPVEKGIEIAGKVLKGMGAASLIDWVASHVTNHAEHVPIHIVNLAPTVQQHGQQAAFDFAQAPHLPVGHPLALPMLCISTLHQYGFWNATTEGGWQSPMYAKLDGVTHKGSDFIWAAFARAAIHDPELLTIDRMASDATLFSTICTADDGTCPVPDVSSHETLHQAHGQWMQRCWPAGYTGLLSHVNESDAPVKMLLEILRKSPGYRSDPLDKKANLLAVILGARPEGFLAMKDPQSICPIVDYHMMRVCLRTGLVHIENPELKQRIASRQWVDSTEELSIRQATSHAIQGLVEHTGCSVAAIDGLFFKIGRSHCVENAEPHCTECPLERSCAKQTTLFQPVFRTTAY